MNGVPPTTDSFLGGLGENEVLVLRVPLGRELVPQRGDLLGRGSLGVEGLVPLYPSLRDISDPTGVGVAVRMAAKMWDHRHKGSRYGSEEQVGGRQAQPTPARNHLVHARSAVAEDAFALHDNTPEKVDVVEGGADAEVT